MSERSIAKRLLEYGLTDTESIVYVYVAKRGPCPAGEIARSLSIRRGRTYDVLRALQEKGIVETIPGRPVRFSAVPLPRAVDILLAAHRLKERLMEKTKLELLAMWESAPLVRAEDDGGERLQFLRGAEGIYRKAGDMIDEARKDLLLIAPELGLLNMDRHGVLKKVYEASRRNVDVRVLAEITSRVWPIITRLGAIGARAFSGYPSPHFLIVDGKQIVFLTKPLQPLSSGEATAIWTNAPMLVRTMQHFFENLWSSATSVAEASPTLRHEQTRDTLTEDRYEPVKALQNEFAKYLEASGFEVRKDYAMIGSSGAEHLFSLALFRDRMKPIVIDIESSDKSIGPVDVIKFFAKKFDVESQAADATLIVKPDLDREARRLAAFYGIRFTELGSRALDS